MSFLLNRPVGDLGSSLVTRRLDRIHDGSNSGEIGKSPPAVETVFFSVSMRTGFPCSSSPKPDSMRASSASSVSVDRS